MKEIIAAAGGHAALAAACGVNRTTVYGWAKVPPQHVSAAAKASGIPAHVLRPDLAAAFTRRNGWRKLALDASRNIANVRGKK